MTISAKQKKVMKQIFKAEEDEDDILDHNNVSRGEFNIWVDSEEWSVEFERHIKKNERRAQVIISNYQSVAAVKLVELTDCEKEPTARQACLDIIQMPRILEEKQTIATTEILTINDKTANEILKILARDEKDKKPK